MPATPSPTVFSKLRRLDLTASSNVEFIIDIKHPQKAGVACHLNGHMLPYPTNYPLDARSKEKLLLKTVTN